MTKVIILSVRIPKKELEAFENAVRKSERFLNRSEALRFLIREFVKRVCEEGRGDKEEEGVILNEKNKNL